MLAVCFPVMLRRALPRNCYALVYALENDLDNDLNTVLNTGLNNGLNYDLLCSTSAVL